MAAKRKARPKVTVVATDEVTNRDLYNAISEIRIEFNGSIQRLDDKFMQLEAGRLTRAEGNINDLRVDLQKVINNFNSSIEGTKVSQASWDGKLVILGLIASLFLAALLNFIAFKIAGTTGVK